MQGGAHIADVGVVIQRRLGILGCAAFDFFKCQISSVLVFILIRGVTQLEQDLLFLLATQSAQINLSKSNLRIQIILGLKKIRTNAYRDIVPEIVLGVCFVELLQ